MPRIAKGRDTTQKSKEILRSMYITDMESIYDGIIYGDIVILFNTI